MPPNRASTLTGSFSVTDVNNEVVCPLRNQDGSSCRKRCLGEKRYRSMQEHIRRAHPEYYIPKLPATKESFELMITSPPHERPPPQEPSPQQHRLGTAHTQQHSDPSGLSPAFLLDSTLSSSLSQGGSYGGHQHHPVHHPHHGIPGLGQHDGGYYTADDADAAAIYSSMQEAQQRSPDEYRRGSLIPAASAAAALAQLHYHRGPEADWAGDHMGQSYYADQHNNLKTSPSHFHVDPALEEAGFLHHDHHHHASSSSFPPPPPSSSGHEAPAVGGGSGSLLPSGLARSPLDRPTTLPPLQRSASNKHSRQRKNSLSQQARMAKHERRKSRELAKRNSGGDRKAFSAEPTSAAALYGKRWEDLIDAATSATEEEGSRDLTPIPASPYQSPAIGSRTSLPPFALGSQFQSFQASPLNRALTPPPADGNLDLQPFPSVESSLSSTMSHSHGHHSSADSGSQFQIMNPSALDSSPMFQQNNGGASSQAAAEGNNGAVVSANGGAVGGGNGNGATSAIVQIYCAGCKRLNNLQESYACTNCISGLCGTCVEALVDNQRTGRLSGCPRCGMHYGSFKQFQLDLR